MLALQIEYLVLLGNNNKQEKLSTSCDFVHHVRSYFPVSVIISTWGHVPGGNAEHPSQSCRQQCPFLIFKLLSLDSGISSPIHLLCVLIICNEDMHGQHLNRLQIN